MEANNSPSGWKQMKAAAHPAHMPKPKPPVAPLPEPMPMPTFPEVSPPAGACCDMKLVMSYVKMQEWDQTYEGDTALERGTIFPELDLPFVGEGACLND